MSDSALCQTPFQDGEALRILANPSHTSLPFSQRPRSLDDPYAIPHPRNKASTKIQKRSVKHASLLSRLKRKAPNSGVKKRRRPSKKLVTDLVALEDALPESLKGVAGTRNVNGEFRNKHTSLKSRPGAMKRKEKLMIAERERFAKNLALMASGPDEVAKGEREGSMKLSVDQESENTTWAKATSRNRIRWTAVRNHISQTMETIDPKSSSR